MVGPEKAWLSPNQSPNFYSFFHSISFSFPACFLQLQILCVWQRIGFKCVWYRSLYSSNNARSAMKLDLDRKTYGCRLPILVALNWIGSKHWRQRNEISTAYSHRGAHLKRAVLKTTVDNNGAIVLWSTSWSSREVKGGTNGTLRFPFVRLRFHCPFSCSCLRCLLFFPRLNNQQKLAHFLINWASKGKLLTKPFHITYYINNDRTGKNRKQDEKKIAKNNQQKLSSKSFVSFFPLMA